LLRYVKHCAMGLIGGLLLTFFVTPSFAAVKAVETFVDSTWANEIYYIASLSGYYGQNSGYDDITVRITAVDEYTLYINGNLIGSDNDWKTVETYTANLAGSKTINIAVKVTNHGFGVGNGLVVDVQAGSDLIGTTTKFRESSIVKGSYVFIPVAWYTYDNTVKTAIGASDADWYKIDANYFNDTTRINKMKKAMSGSMGDLDYDFNPNVEVIAGYLSTNVDVGSTTGGGISLRKLEGENLAYGKPSDEVKITDGDLKIGFEWQSSALGSSKYVDLGQIYRVNAITLFTGGDNPQTYPLYSPRGYSVEISLDEYRWEEIGVIHEVGITNADAGAFDNYTIDFPPEWARYVRFKITETRINQPRVGEMMVFGQGYILAAKYESQWMDMGDPTSIKNFDRITWEGDVPNGTLITIQTRTKNGADGFASAWSDPISAKSFKFMSPEPATHLQYRVNFSTEDFGRTPRFKRLSVSYSKTDQPVASAFGYITPNRVAMGADSTYTYVLAYKLNAGQDIKNVQIAVPGYSTINYAYSSDLGANLDIDTAASYSTIDTLSVVFTNSVKDTKAGAADTLYINFNTKLYKSSHVFDAQITNSNGNDGAGPVKVWENTTLGSNIVVISSILKSVLTDVKAVPKVFTPNSDGKNDYAVIEFTLAKVQTKVKIKIFSTAGSLVATICDEDLGARRYEIGGNYAGAKNLPGYWDGKDEDGDMVPPGIYVYQVIADTDSGNITENGTIVVAY